MRQTHGQTHTRSDRRTGRKKDRQTSFYFEKLLYLESIKCPASKLHGADLLVKWKVLDINEAGGFKYGGAEPRHTTIRGDYNVGAQHTYTIFLLIFWEYLFIASYYRHLSADIKMKNYKIKISFF